MRATVTGVVLSGYGVTLNPIYTPEDMYLSTAADSVTLTASPSLASTAGTVVTLTATVEAPAGSIDTPTGSVAFVDTYIIETTSPPTTMTSTLATVGLSDYEDYGVATFTTSTLEAGYVHAITADYEDGNYVSNKSTTLNYTIFGITITTSDTYTEDGSYIALPTEPLTFTASISPTTDLPSGTSFPTGYVTFYDSSTPLGSEVALTGNLATFVYSSLSVGSHSIAADYSGDGYYSASISPAISETVDAASGSAPSVADFSFNNGMTGLTQGGTYMDQHSRVISITVTFTAAVHPSPLQEAGAFTLTRKGLPNGERGDDATIGNIAASFNDDDTQATLIFSGANTEGGSLADGSWQLVIIRTDVVSAGGLMSSNYISNTTLTPILRLFGDQTGSGTVDSTDLGMLGATFGLTSSSPAFLPAFDSDGNGIIDSIDLGRFGTNFGLTI